MVRALAGIYASGATLVLITLLLPHFPLDTVPVALIATMGYPAAILLMVVGRRLPYGAFHALLGMGIVMVGAGAYYGRGGPGTAAGASLYVWAALYAFYFFSWTAVVVHMVLIGGSYAVALALLDTGAKGIQQWLLTVGTALVAGVVVGALGRQVRRLARIDDLTGLVNRRGWEELLEREMARSARDHAPVCIALIDLDHFKTLNDLGGHQAGDRFLVQLAQAWGKAVRKADVLARWGGDEFAVLLPQCTLDAADEVLARMQAATVYGQTFSAGLAAWDGSEALDHLIHRADEALYQAKDDGRDRITRAA